MSLPRLIEEVLQAEATSDAARALELVVPSAEDEPPAATEAEAPSDAARALELVVPSAEDEPPAATEIEVDSTESRASESHAELLFESRPGEPNAELPLPVTDDEPARVEIDEPQTEGQSSVSRFVADTAWTTTAGFPELGVLHATVSTTTEALWQAELRPPDSTVEALYQGRSPNPSVRSATLPDPGLPPEGQHPRPVENLTRPGESRQRRRTGLSPQRPVAEPDLPSAKEILAAVSRQSSPPEKQPQSAGRNQATPTVSCEPGQWSAPLWLFWPPAVLLTLFLGIAASVLSWRWAGDAYCASVVARESLVPPANPGRVKPLPEAVVPPEPSWWHTTPLHLVQWGVYLGRPGLEGNRTGEGRQLLDAATQMAPLDPLARLSRVQLSGRPGDPASLRAIWASVVTRPAWPGVPVRSGLADARRPQFTSTGRLCGLRAAAISARLRVWPGPRALPSMTILVSAGITCRARQWPGRSCTSFSLMSTGRCKNGPRPCPGIRSPPSRRPGCSANRSPGGPEAARGDRGLVRDRRSAERYRTGHPHGNQG